jgi:hypothetical protein
MNNGMSMKCLLGLSFVFLFSQMPAQDDRGIGVIFFLQSAPTLDNPKGDSVLIYSKPNGRSSVVDRFIFDPKDRYRQFINTRFQSKGSIEFDNETFGLPVRSSLARGWFEVIYDKNKQPGFVKISKSILKYLTWRELLPKKFLFFQSVSDIQFFDSPNGKRQEFELAQLEHQKYDYIMKPITTEGNWMKVEIVTPSDNCHFPEIIVKAIFWIKYLDDNGRPLVWYFTRGC